MPYIRKDGDKIFYVEKGIGEPPLLFVHGVGGTVFHWKKQIERFKDTNRIVAVDLPGCGKSDDPETDYMIESSARTVDVLVDALDLKGLVWVGHSMGGWIGLQYSQMFPTKLKGLIVVDSIVGFADSPFVQMLSRRYDAAKRGKDVFPDLLKSVANNMFTHGGDQKFKEEVRRDYLKTKYETFCGHLGSVLATMKETFHDKSLASKRKVNIPILIVSRDADEDRDKSKFLIC
ncbi:MAG: alpha/beta hydrolase [Thaumarchaeota archaeon]|nr:alpha/beta hydrolase [Nitrososphaerota archaeon]